MPVGPAFISSMRLSELISALPDHLPVEFSDKEIFQVCQDSRQVRTGSLFVAISGGITDGHRFIPDAIQRGAAGVVGTQAVSGLPVPYVRVADSRKALAYLAAAFHGFPARLLSVIGVTGTDGKTTTCNLLHQILKSAGLPTGMISTVNALVGDRALDTGFHVTTPDALDVQSYLLQMVEVGMSHVILEATSHGLSQHRVSACDFDMGVVTNITHEHLDFHGSYDAYQAAKGLLFAALGETPEKKSRPHRGAVLNRDDPSFLYLSEITKVDFLTYGASKNADIRPEVVEMTSEGLSFRVVGRDLEGTPFSLFVSTPLVGEFNLTNCLAAITLARGIMLLPDETVVAGLASFPGVPGRMEKINIGQDFQALVDFAHTPNALRQALETARKLTQGRVITLFGSAGLRDRLKRRLMAETAAELADFTILTSEDPRSESLNVIVDEMALGLVARGGVEGQTFQRVPDRREAMRVAVQRAKAGDLVIACGKGHEQSMCFGETEYPWDDRIAMRAALAERLGVPGPNMPFLPNWD